MAPWSVRVFLVASAAADYPSSYAFTASYMICLYMSNFDKPLVLLDSFIATVMCIDPPHVSKAKLRTLKGTSRDAVRFFRDASHGLLPGGNVRGLFSLVGH